MIMLEKSKGYNPNYLAKVVCLRGLKRVEGADKLQQVVIDFRSVVTGLDAMEGDIYVYFPVESSINEDFLRETSSYRDGSLNKNGLKGSGFFEKSGRVRAIRLRGIPSNGYIVPMDVVASWAFGNKPEGEDYGKYVDIEFDTIGGKRICEKYVPSVGRVGGLSKKVGFMKRESKVLDGQFHFHNDTKHLDSHTDVIRPNDIISVTYKIHGTSGIASKVLVQKKLSILDKLLKRLGVNIEDREYGFLYSSRRVIKNAYLCKNANSFYDEDIWGLACKKYELEDKLPNGFSVYFEIAGYLPGGIYIQKDYDYGFDKGDFGIYVYRVTYTNIDGLVTELTHPQMVEFCEKLDLPMPELFYYGPAVEIFSRYKEKKSEDNIFGENLLLTLRSHFNEKDCFMCSNDVPEEGVVVRIERLNECKNYKVKSFRFLEKESRDNDSGEMNIEDGN